MQENMDQINSDYAQLLRSVSQWRTFQASMKMWSLQDGKFFFFLLQSINGFYITELCFTTMIVIFVC